MTEPLDKLAGEIQADMDRQIRETYGETVWQRWRRPAHMGEPARPDGSGSATGTCGDTIQIFLSFRDNTVSDAGFLTDGCGPSVVCGSLAAEMAMGKTVRELAAIDGRTILEALGGLPEDENHCAFLAANALEGAVDDYQGKNRNQPKTEPPA